MNIRKLTLAAALAIAALMFALTILGTLADAAGASARPYLADAPHAPTELSLLRPGKSVTYAHGIEGWNCKQHGWFSDVQAYTWYGGPAARQTRSGDGTLIRWGRVTFDGITFHNGSRRAVLVAGWCE